MYGLNILMSRPGEWCEWALREVWLWIVWRMYGAALVHRHRTRLTEPSFSHCDHSALLSR